MLEEKNQTGQSSKEKKGMLTLSKRRRKKPSGKTAC
jgi:hypothetical protein